jgi:hypothetical protein
MRRNKTPVTEKDWDRWQRQHPRRIPEEQETLTGGGYVPTTQEEWDEWEAKR